MFTKLFSRKALLIWGVLFSSLFVVSVVSADTVSGTGWLAASGDGQVVLRGDMGTLHIKGTGTLYFKDAGEVHTPTITGAGKRIELPNGWVQYIGFNGTLHLTEADQAIVRLEGRDIQLYIEGTGDVWLRGRGHYRYNNGNTIISGTWPAAGHSIEIAPAE
ncbi:MAG: hypothetical protein KC421_16855 [Anaerolineales bacterium]|nr:hypothetical protein [Anaerolineales bacterium]